MCKHACCRIRSMEKLLFIDDDKEVLEMNVKYMRTAGYEAIGSDNALEGLRLVSSKKPDCVILDVMMPGLNGYEVCKRIREFSDIPIIFLTGKSMEDDKLKGLMLGGDDYIIKPYSLKELKARIDVILRRIAMVSKRTKQDTNIIEFGDVKIDRMSHKVFFGDVDLALTNREYEALSCLLDNPDRTVTFEEIGKKIFGQYLETDRQTIMVIVSRFRKKIKVCEEFSAMIETVWSKGYKFTPRNE